MASNFYDPEVIIYWWAPLLLSSGGIIYGLSQYFSGSRKSVLSASSLGVIAGLIALIFIGGLKTFIPALRELDSGGKFWPFVTFGTLFTTILMQSSSQKLGVIRTLGAIIFGVFALICVMWFGTIIVVCPIWGCKL